MGIWKRLSIGASALALVGGGVLIVAAPVASAGASSPPVLVHCGGPGGGSPGLIAAINTENSAGGGTIDLAANCNYDFTAANNGTLLPTGANALPVVTTAITINGNGTALVGIAATFRILEVSTPNGNLTFNGLQITGGDSAAGGGGILDYQGTLVLNNNSEVNGNTLANVAGPAGPIGGGGILSYAGTVSVNNSEVVDNTAPADGGGGILNFGGQLSVINSEVDHNAAITGGGVVSGNGNAGAPLPGGVTLLINNSAVKDNVATCTICGGTGLTVAGGIANADAATIEHSDVDGHPRQRNPDSH
jgi:hypothetical protein